MDALDLPLAQSIPGRADIQAILAHAGISYMRQLYGADWNGVAVWRAKRVLRFRVIWGRSPPCRPTAVRAPGSGGKVIVYLSSVFW